MMKDMRLTWGVQDKTFDAIRATPGSLGEATSLCAYLIVWSLAMAAYIGAFAVTGVVTSLLVLVWLPCFLQSKVSWKDKLWTLRHGLKARLLQ
jgi:amino acid permease